MATQKVERQLNLVIALLSTHGYLTAEKIHRSVTGYAECATDEAFARMFERDKGELRDLGIPLQTGKVAGSDTVEGYRINRDAYALPDIDLTAQEAAAVAIATALWQTPEWATVTEGALLKLRAAGVDVDADPIPFSAPMGLPGLRGAEDVLAVLLAAVSAGQAVRFRHRSSPAVPYSQRTIEPWGVVTVGGRWYLVGHDRDREDVRTFRVSRIRSDIETVGAPGAVGPPPGTDVRAIAAAAVSAAEPSAESVPVRVWVADGRANSLRRIGTEVADRVRAGRPGQILEIDTGPRESLLRDIAGHGADAVVLAPSDLREKVLTRLRAAAGTGDRR
ncbi:helix-turn-helix transcriptional regulator [Mycolicibacterium fallax]|uniref:Transcriptional regulator n=1 Tax=Mycolicibacterium fallax TaxID=1793 RepID=A0A1X1R518_MYCFA|nr:WYL domain-containing protein [Mycolicibacterium fallax]ORU99368.1 transcriptional regulator [Mycolicibacterium fallax]BBY97702.1 protein PafB [Mycolicibacterium fallax]HOW94932.1 WYL domain-containing protein [Mycolicibacterium fallax]